MTKRELNEVKESLKLLKSGRDTIEKMSDEQCIDIFGIPKDKVLKNLNAGIERYENKITR